MAVDQADFLFMRHDQHESGCGEIKLAAAFEMPAGMVAEFHEVGATDRLGPEDHFVPGQADRFDGGIQAARFRRRGRHAIDRLARFEAAAAAEPPLSPLFVTNSRSEFLRRNFDSAAPTNPTGMPITTEPSSNSERSSSASKEVGEQPTTNIAGEKLLTALNIEE